MTPASFRLDYGSGFNTPDARETAPGGGRARASKTETTSSSARHCTPPSAVGGRRTTPKRTRGEVTVKPPPLRCEANPGQVFLESPVGSRSLRRRRDATPGGGSLILQGEGHLGQWGGRCSAAPVAGFPCGPRSSGRSDASRGTLRGGGLKGARGPTQGPGSTPPFSKSRRRGGRLGGGRGGWRDQGIR